jgi:hypoxanthine-guanine phosphoribosyltransferase
MLFGTAIHGALDEYFKSRTLAKAVEAFDANWTHDDPEDPVRTRVLGHKLLKKYHEKYETDGIEVVRFEDRKVVEFPIAPGVLFVGKLDKIVRWDRMTLVMEHKTSKYIMLNRYNPNLQISGYVWLAKQLGHKIAGALVDVIQTAATKQELFRDLQTRSEEHDVEFVTTITKVAKRIQEDTALNSFEPNFDACTRLGECPYRRICKHNPAIQEAIIKSEFIVVPRPIVEETE